jgi:hypothetical protein
MGGVGVLAGGTQPGGPADAPTVARARERLTTVAPVGTKSPTECGRARTQSALRASATSPPASIAWMAPERPVGTTIDGVVDRMPGGAGSAMPVATNGLTGDASTTRRPARATSAATATGRSE